jgi:hypothetical protein
MSKADYLEGVVWFALTTGPIVVAATWLLRRRLAELSGALAVVAWGILVTAGLVAEGLIPGMLGILSRGTVALTAVALAAGVWIATRTRAAAEKPDGGVESRRSGVLSVVLAAAALVLVAVYVLALIIDRRGMPIIGIDALTFGLPTISRWIQDGSVWSVGHYAVGWGFGAYPNNGELVQLAAILPWRSDAFVRLFGFPYLLLSGVSVFALARELRAPRAAAVAWSCATVAVPAGLLAALEYQKTDVLMVACFVGGAAFLVRHSRTGATSDLVIASLGIGLAFGARWYGVTGAAALIATWVVARAVARVGVAVLVRQTLLAVGVILAAGGFWLLRNLVHTGDPLFPVKVAPLGITLFDAPPDVIRMRGGFSLLHYVSSVDVWRDYLWPELRDGFSLAGGLALLAAVAGLLGFRRGGERRTAVVAAAALLLAAVYAATPYTAQGPDGAPVQAFVNIRYALPAVALGAAVAAALACRGRRSELVSTALGLIACIDALLHVDDAGLAPFLSDVVRPTRVAEAVIALACVVAATVLLRSRLRPAVVLACALAAIGFGYVHERGYTRTGYLGMDPAIDPVLRWDGRPLTIAIAGSAPADRLGPAQPLIGADLENKVRVVGPVVRHTLQPIRTPAQLVAGLSQGYDVVFLMREHRNQKAPEDGWVRALGYREVANGPSATLFTRAAGGPALP